MLDPNPPSAVDLVGIRKRLVVLLLLVALLAGGGFYWMENRFLRGATPVPGRITRITRRPKAAILHVTFEFQGRKRSFTERYGGLPELLQRMRVGQDVTVLYNPDTPPHTMLDILFIKHSASLVTFLSLLFLGLIVWFAIGKVIRQKENA